MLLHKPPLYRILQPQPNRPHHAAATMSSEKNETPEKPEVPSFPGDLEDLPAYAMSH
jgi:hypothetical protein